MANVKDISAAIHSALEEVGVSGVLAIHMDGERTTTLVGQSGGDDFKVAVDIEDLSDHRTILQKQLQEAEGEKQ